MKNNKNLAKPILAVALAASFFASPLNVNQVEAAKHWYKAAESETQEVSEDAWNHLGTRGYVYGRNTAIGNDFKSGVDISVTRLVKCKKKNTITTDASRGGAFNIYYDGDLAKDMGNKAISGKSYTTKVKKNYYANKMNVSTYSKSVTTYCCGYFQRKSADAKSASWELVGEYRSNSKATTIYIKGKVSKDGTVTVTSDNGVVKQATMKKIKSCVRELWLNKVDYPAYTQYGEMKNDKNAVRVE